MHSREQLYNQALTHLESVEVLAMTLAKDSQTQTLRDLRGKVDMLYMRLKKLGELLELGVKL